MKTYYLTETQYKVLISRFPEAQHLNWSSPSGEPTGETYYNIDIDFAAIDFESESAPYEFINTLQENAMDCLKELKRLARPSIVSPQESYYQDRREAPDGAQQIQLSENASPPVENTLSNFLEHSEPTENKYKNAKDGSTILQTGKTRILLYGGIVLACLIILAWSVHYFDPLKNFFRTKDPNMGGKFSEIEATLYVLDIKKMRFIDTVLEHADGTQVSIYATSGYKGVFKPDHPVNLQLWGYEWAEAADIQGTRTNTNFQALVDYFKIRAPFIIKTKDDNRLNVDDIGRIAIFAVKSSNKLVKILLSPSIDCDVLIEENITPPVLRPQLEVAEIERFPQTLEFKSGDKLKASRMQREQKYIFHVRPTDTQYKRYQFSKYYRGETELVIPVYKDYLKILNQVNSRERVRLMAAIRRELADQPGHPDHDELNRLFDEQ